MSSSTQQPIPQEAHRWRWYHGALLYVVAQSVTAGLSALVSGVKEHHFPGGRKLLGDPTYFGSLKQAKFTPPAWAFGPAWTINNLCTIWGLLRVLNKPPDTNGRDVYLKLQAFSWLNYSVFSAAYFALRSPINALLLTLSFLVLTILSGLVALFRMRDSLVALSLATLFLWLLIALGAASFQAAWNKDDLYRVGPFAHPYPAWVK